jgi:DNA-binding NarL/FixJ family response regulator
MAKEPIRVAILDDHQSIIDGYYYRLGKEPAIEIVGAVHFGEDLEALLARQPVDVLLLDVFAPTSATNSNPYPIIFTIPQLQQRYPGLAALVISMHDDPTLVKAVLEGGASGYILKDDVATIQALAAVVLAVASGGVHFSAAVYQTLQQQPVSADEPILTRRQLEALSLCAAYPGEPYAHLAVKLGVTESTVRNLLSGAYVRLDVRNRAEAVHKARELRLITPLTPPGAEAQTQGHPGGGLLNTERPRPAHE